MLFAINHVQNKKKNGIDFSVILISCSTQQAFDWTLNTLMLYFCLLQIRNGVSTRHKAKAICKNNEVKLRKKENYPLYFQAKGMCFCKAIVRGHTAAWLKSHTLFISVPPFSSKLDFNFNAWYKKPLLGLCFCLLSSHRSFLLANTSSTLVFVLLSFGHGFRLYSQSASCRRLCFWNLPVSCLSAVLAWPTLQQTKHNQSLASTMLLA